MVAGGMFYKFLQYSDDSFQQYFRFGVSSATTDSRFGLVPTDFILDQVACTGTELSLLDCGHNVLNDEDCWPDEGAGVVCSTTVSHSVIELRGGSHSREGNVFINNQPVCDDGWDLNDAYVTCRMMG